MKWLLSIRNTVPQYAPEYSRPPLSALLSYLEIRCIKKLHPKVWGSDHTIKISGKKENCLKASLWNDFNQFKTPCTSVRRPYLERGLRDWEGLFFTALAPLNWFRARRVTKGQQIWHVETFGSWPSRLQLLFSIVICRGRILQKYRNVPYILAVIYFNIFAKTVAENWDSKMLLELSWPI